MTPKLQYDSVTDNHVLNMLHDIRNHVAAIELAHKLLQEEIDESGVTTGDIDQLHSVISKNIALIGSQLHEVLLPKPAKPDKFAKYDLARIIDMALNRAQDRLDLARVKVQKNYMPGHHITCHPDELATAFFNIIINAIEAVEPGNGELWVTAYEVDRHLKVIFKDNGVGIPPELLERLFEPHFSSKPNGLGIGLTSVRKVLEDLKATINIMSEPGNGTTVIIVF